MACCQLFSLLVITLNHNVPVPPLSYECHFDVRICAWMRSNSFFSLIFMLICSSDFPFNFCGLLTIDLLFETSLGCLMIHSIMHAQTILLSYTNCEIPYTSFSCKVQEYLIFFMDNILLKEKCKSLGHEKYTGETNNLYKCLKSKKST